ncbi:hypothetical protein CHARACLAT_008074 [Characodon lateralis]|uniref:Uncharacterized protein n=1 Tax=Characodon lateralis TaxID=208331 RepID=A0ABU7ES35_9TELE|nr:hypothetical protein [Characodon lateralis]
MSMFFLSRTIQKICEEDVTILVIKLINFVESEWKNIFSSSTQTHLSAEAAQDRNEEQQSCIYFILCFESNSRSLLQGLHPAVQHPEDFNMWEESGVFSEDFRQLLFHMHNSLRSLRGRKMESLLLDNVQWIVLLCSAK